MWVMKSIDKRELDAAIAVLKKVADYPFTESMLEQEFEDEIVDEFDNAAQIALIAMRDMRKRMEGCEWCLERERKKTYTMFWERDKRGNPKSARQRMKGKERYCSVCGRSKLPSTCKARNSNENGAGNASGANDEEGKDREHL